MMQLENGGTAAVAGLTDSRYHLDQQGVPGLGGLPLLGRAFRTDNLNFQARQVAVFVTATCVDEFGNPVGITPKTVAAPVVTLNDDEYRDELALALD
jgi:type II secretory pathway component GspD/PulD (secretin)